MNSLLSTFLVGMLLASMVLNVHQWRDESLSVTPETATLTAITPAKLAAITPATEAGPLAALPASFDVEQLCLSAEQQAKLSSCGDGCCCEAMALREQVRDATVALQEACAQQDVDEANLLLLAADLCTLREREVQEHVAALLAVREVLSPKQMEELRRSACEGCTE